MNRRVRCVAWSLTAAAMLAVGVASAVADEGMWLFDNPPAKLLQEKYDFTPTDEWMTHLQRASVRFNSGGSGSFVSPNGLVMTNHHVGADALHKLSTAETDYLKTGFHAAGREDEIKCVDLELNVLMSIEDVTDRVNGAVQADGDPAQAQQARRAVMNTIEQESLKATGLRSDVITLYHGGLYHLYRFKKYTDVRLVFAPEQDIAFFGGDPDNFEYPRYDLDVCFFRVYEDDKPIETEHHLTWSKSGAADGELVFVSGHPGHTDRLNTVAHLEFIRDRSFPLILNLIRRREVMLKTFGERSDENARRSKDELFGYQNSRKARLGMLAGLQDPALMGRKAAAEEAFRTALSENAKIQKSVGNAWDEVDSALAVWREIHNRRGLLESGWAFNTQLFRIARSILRQAEETSKPNADRLREFRESNLESLAQQIFSEAPIHADLETVKLADSLGMLVELAGANNPLAKKVLAGKSPRDRAAQLVGGTKLADVALRRKLADGGLDAVSACDDPMIELARAVDKPARHYRKIYEEKVEEPLRQAYARIANARFALYGTDNYPDATFTLRLAFGEVRGYSELGQPIPPWTTIGGAYDHAQRHGHKPPFALPQSWIDRKDKLDLDTPYNFICTADIIGGNSGSPLVNRRAEVVGLVFDGNLHSLVWDFAFDQEKGRTTSVHSAAIVEALTNVYQADALVAELTGSKTGPELSAARR